MLFSSNSTRLQLCTSPPSKVIKALPSEYKMDQSRELTVLVLTKVAVLYNPLHPDIRIHILHTVLYTFPLVLMRRILSTVQNSHA